MASAAVKVKTINNNQVGSSSRGNAAVVKKKIEATIRQQSVVNKNKFQPPKTVKSEPLIVKEKGKTTTPTKKREKKVYSLPGQKYDTPEERDPLRIFYESLSEQIPSSEMAEFWLMEHGMLSPERAKKAYEKKQRKQKMGKMGTPMKAPPPPSRPESSSRHSHNQASKNGDTKTKKRMVYDSDEEIIRSPKMRRA